MKTLKYGVQLRTIELITHSNQYKLLDLKTKRVVWSRDVTILEGVFPYKWKNTEDYDINDYINSNNNYEIIIDNAITSHISFKGANNVDRAEKQLTSQQLECDISLESENNSQNTQNKSEINDLASVSNDNSQIADSESNECDELNSKNSQNNISSNNAINTHKRVISNDLSDDELAFAIINNSNINDPVTYKQAIESSNAKNWKIAMKKEIDDLKSQNTWNLVNAPKNRQIIKGRSVFKTKLDKNGCIDKYKAWWVAKRFQQKYGIDYIETFSNTVKLMVFRALFALAAFKDLEIQQWNIKLAFPNASIDEEIYVIQPIGFEENSNRVCLLNKALYGLKQSARQFYLFSANLLKELNFNSIVADQSVFYNSKSNIIITAHIDDLLVFAENKNEINSLKLLKG